MIIFPAAVVCIAQFFFVRHCLLHADGVSAQSPFWCCVVGLSIYLFWWGGVIIQLLFFDGEAP
jgi:hypothetical protein